jgi:hypothetical protein
MDLGTNSSNNSSIKNIINMTRKQIVSNYPEQFKKELRKAKLTKRFFDNVIQSFKNRNYSDSEIEDFFKSTHELASNRAILANSFIWDDTPEGDDFWRKFADDFYWIES